MKWWNQVTLHRENNMPLELLDWVDTFLILKFFSLVHNFWIIKFPIWCTLCTVHIADLDLTGNFGQSKFSTPYKTLVIDTLFTTDTKFVSTRYFRIIEKSVEETQFHTQVKKTRSRSNKNLKKKETKYQTQVKNQKNFIYLFYVKVIDQNTPIDSQSAPKCP